MNAFISELANFSGLPSWLALMIVIWTIPWKAVALWKAARKNDKVWFIIILLVNTIGILEILYIFLISKKRKGADE